MAGGQRLRGRPDHRAGLEHEGHGVLDHVRLRQIGIGGLVEGRCIRAVAAHAVVQRRPARHEAFGLGVVGTMHQAHELAGDVARGGKIAKSMLLVPGVSLGECSTRKIDGSGWS
ncbi:hypothetical protein G6F62_015078 [Rhizopus arrhizus]|nr:hypothetical protein G6F62_015078 [Rhizopus arrhizus]